MKLRTLLCCSAILLAAACQSKKKLPETTKTEAPSMDTFAVVKSKNLTWNDTISKRYYNTCLEGAKVNPKLDGAKYCSCMVALLQSKKISPSETTIRLNEYRPDMVQCAKNAVIH